MLSFQKQSQRTIQPVRWALTAAIFAGVTGLAGCVYHRDHDDFGRPAGFYVEHDEGWHRDHDRDHEGEHFEHHGDWDHR